MEMLPVRLRCNHLVVPDIHLRGKKWDWCVLKLILSSFVPYLRENTNGISGFSGGP